MTSSKSSQTRHVGLRLSLKGAPDVPHTVTGIIGLYRPSRPTPVGGPGEPTVEEAERAAKGKGSPVEIVELKAGEVDGLRAAAAADHELARGNAETFEEAERLVAKQAKQEPVEAEPSPTPSTTEAAEGGQEG